MSNKIDIGSIPKELLNERQWICWQYEARNGSKPAKAPVSYPDGHRCDLTEPSNWTDGISVCAGYTTRYDGIGFVFSADDPYVGIDLDDCIDENGVTEDWAESILERVTSYAEYSPSGKGIHIIVKGSLPSDAKNRRGNVEIYDRARFFTVTGNHIDGTPDTVEDAQDAIESVWADFVVPTETESSINTGGGGTSTATASGLADDDLVDRAKHARNGAKFCRLWDGDYSGYPSQSEADQALCNHLAFWTRKDRAQIDRLFRQSGLMRNKWDEQHGGQTYGELTIESAIDMTDNIYEGTADGELIDEYDTDYPSLDDVKQMVCMEFDERTWDATEAVLAAHATLLIGGKSGGTGLMLVGPSSSGKTTVLSFFEGLEDQVYRSDDLTPASFVSHDASKSNEQLEKIDLLPKIGQKTLLSRDMSTWFAGEQEHIHKRMSNMTHLLDGQGFLRDSGSHGRRGYEGDKYRFNFIGATTPLQPRAWRVMGNVGNRLLFHEKRGVSDTRSAVDDILDGSEYGTKVSRCREVVHAFLDRLWCEHGGFGSIVWETDEDEAVRCALDYLAEVIRYARATFNGEGISQEGPHRIIGALYDIARGHAILCGRDQVTIDDLQVCARIALSTMPAKRRTVLQELLNPVNQGRLSSGQVETVARVSRPTAHDRMEELATLGFARLSESDDDGRGTKQLELLSDFEWPDSLDFPEFRS